MVAKVVYDISLEMLRLNVVQSLIFGVFEDMYERLECLRLRKFEVYALVKMLAAYYLRRYCRLKEKVRYFTRDTPNDKYYLLTSMLDFKKIAEIREKVTRKIEEDVQLQLREKRGREGGL